MQMHWNRPSKTAFAATTLVCVLIVLRATAAANVSSGPTLHVVAAFEARNRVQYSRVLQKTLNDINDDPGYPFRLVGITIGVAGDAQLRTSRAPPNNVANEQLMNVDASIPDAVKDLCNVLDDNNVTVVLVLAMAEETTSFAAALVGGYSGVPVLGFPPQGTIYAHNSYKDLNPYFQAMSPSIENLAEAMAAFLLANVWLTPTLVTDDTEPSRVLSMVLARHLNQTEPHTVVLPVALGGNKSEQVADMLGYVVRQRGRVVVLHCEASLASLIFEHAATLGMLSGDYVWLITGGAVEAHPPVVPTGSLALRLRRPARTKQLVRAAARTFASAMREVWYDYAAIQSIVAKWYNCWYPPDQPLRELSSLIARKLKAATTAAVSGRLRFGGFSGNKAETALQATFDILNLVSQDGGYGIWRCVGNITGGNRITLDAVVWPGGSVVGPTATSRACLRVVTALAPPFVMAVDIQPNGACIRGVPCLRLASKGNGWKNGVDLAAIVAPFEASIRTGVTGSAWAALSAASDAYNVSCCSGFAVDLLVMVARDGEFDYVLYVVADGKFGAKVRGPGGQEQWNGVIGDVISGAAHLAVAPLSATHDRNRRVDFSVPFFYSGVSYLASTKPRQVPLLAFLSPFSWGLWVCIFAGLNATAVAAAIYEWLSPFGLNPWGRQRTKNFSLASALWVMWSLLFSHLVAFKAPKSWPNKVLINLWGCFSVIFLASYTANIAALFAGFFGEMAVENFHDEALLSQRVGTVRSSSVETFLGTRNHAIKSHIQRFGFDNLEEGIHKLRGGELDLMIGDVAILEYYRRKDPGCGFRRVGPMLYEDTYAIAMGKGSLLEENISLLITRYNEYGYLDELIETWFGGPTCFRNPSELYSPLSIQAVAGVFIMLIVGMVIGCLILVMEHIVYKYGLPKCRKMSKGTIWRSPNLMFFSQKLYRFINCVELVSPHHSAKELMKNLRTGQITSLFQKSIKRKENEQRRRRKSKLQFFEMIQEIRRGNLKGLQNGMGSFQKQERTKQNRCREEKREHLPRRGFSELMAHSSNSNSVSSGDICEVSQGIAPLAAAVACSSSLSASIAELYPSRHQPPSLPQRISKVPSYDDLKSWEADLQYDDGQSRAGSSHRFLRLCTFRRHSQWPLGECNNVLRDVPLTKQDFYNLPPRLNDVRLQRLTKDDLVFLWQCCERDLRKRLEQSLKEKVQLEAQLKAHMASSSSSSSDPAVVQPP